MTVDRRIMPKAGAYNAVILACAKSGLRRCVSGAFRSAKEMLDSHRGAEGRGAFSPDRKTFCALVEGARRVGDLPRARWILAEMVRRAGPDRCSSAAEVDASINEEVTMHVFHAYAAYNPPFVRFIAPPAKDASGEVENKSATPDDFWSSVVCNAPPFSTFEDIEMLHHRLMPPKVKAQEK